MFPYYLLLGASLAGGPFLARRPEYRRGYLSVMGLACWLTASMRYVTGFDYRFYESAFQSVAALGLNGAGWSEPGYLLLNWAVSFFSSDYRVFLLVFHLLLTILVFVWIGRCSPSPWLSVFLFISLQYFATSRSVDLSLFKIPALFPRLRNCAAGRLLPPDGAHHAAALLSAHIAAVKAPLWAGRAGGWSRIFPDGSAD